MQINFEEKIPAENIPANSSAWELAKKLNKTKPSEAIAVRVNGEIFDMSCKLSDGDVVHFISFDDREGKNIFWHTSAHVLAQAVMRLWPDTKLTIGPPIENGFYYDFANLSLSDKDFPQIEKEIKKILKENKAPKKEVIKNKQEAISRFPNNKYKQEIIEDFPKDETISIYSNGEFYDLCKGPHLTSLSKIKAFKILKTSGAYWRGDQSQEMLTRIYAISFPDKEMLNSFLHCLEEAKKRDHKILGPKLDLFSLREEAPGMPIIHPAGMRIWNKLIAFWQKLHAERGYIEIKTPIILTRGLWETSGHWDHYKENMYTTIIEERDFAIKPMNCPGCLLYYQNHLHSYKEFPLRIAEIGLVHRYEPSGAVSGLFRVRSFHMDDAHIFVKPEGIEKEILEILSFAHEIYSTFGLSYHLELSTRPDSGTIGSDEDWELTTNSLKNALESFGKGFQINHGDGAFYGPKIDLHIKDSLGRTWQCGTVQLDMSLPERFNIEYTDSDGTRKRPILIHRALYGSIERFLGHLIEHFAGKFPLWISPRPICIIPVADRHVSYSTEIAQKITEKGIYCEIDDSNESVGKKIREAQLKQTNYMLTVGDKEVNDQTVSLRTRNNILYGEIKFSDFISTIAKEYDEKKLESPYENIEK